MSIENCFSCNNIDIFRLKLPMADTLNLSFAKNCELFLQGIEASEAAFTLNTVLGIIWSHIEP